MRDAIAFALGNFTLTFFVLGLLASAIALWGTRRPRPPAVVLEALFAYFLLFSIAFANLYNFVLHVFFGKMAAAFIAWEDSPFQLEVGFASSALQRGDCWRSREASICDWRPSSGWLAFYGAGPAVTFIRWSPRNFAAGNAGVIFYSDVLVPILGFIFLWLQRGAARTYRPR